MSTWGGFALSAALTVSAILTAPFSHGHRGFTAYANPLRSVQQLTPERIDEGVDYTGTGPVYALGPGTVTYVDTTGKWFPDAPDYIAYRLIAGADRGATVYVAECAAPEVHVGQTLTDASVIATMTDCGYGMETGWANGLRLPDSAASPCWSGADNGGGSYPSGYGIDFSDLLQSLGAPPGVVEGPVVCPAPAGALAGQ